MKLLIQRVPTSPRLNLEYRTKIFVLQILQIQIQMQIKVPIKIQGPLSHIYCALSQKKKKFQLNLYFSSSQLGIWNDYKETITILENLISFSPYQLAHSKCSRQGNFLKLLLCPPHTRRSKVLTQNIQTLRRKGALKENFIQPSLPWSIFRNFLQSIYNFASNYYRTRLQSNENTDTFGPLQLLLPLVSTWLSPKLQPPEFLEQGRVCAAIIEMVLAEQSQIKSCQKPMKNCQIHVQSIHMSLSVRLINCILLYELHFSHQWWWWSSLVIIIIIIIIITIIPRWPKLSSEYCPLPQEVANSIT